MKQMICVLLTIFLLLNLTACGASDVAQSEPASFSAESSESCSEQNTEEQTRHYVLNTSSKKFHLPDCGSVKLMSDKNRQDVEANREKLIEQGYSPCGNCDP